MYVSISGIVRPRNMYQLEAHAERIGLQPELFFGIQATEKTQIQRIANSRGNQWHPVGESIHDSFCDSEMEAYTFGRYKRLGKRIVHFSYEAGRDNFDAHHITREVLDRWPLWSAPIDGWQLNNLDWTKHNFKVVINYLRQKLNGGVIIGQLNKSVLENLSTQTLSNIHESRVDYALLDSSGGMGEGFDLETYRRYIHLIKECAPEIAIAVAGGLGADTSSMDDFVKLIEEFGLLSCDAEGRLRTYPEDKKENLSRSLLSYEKCRDYLNRISILNIT